MMDMQVVSHKIKQANNVQGDVICPYCGQPAKMVTGEDIYPHRPELYEQNFWRCEPCDAHVGCHKPDYRLGFDGTQPLGRLANYELRAAKRAAHSSFDPLWQLNGVMRRDAYAWLAKQLDIHVDDCHIGTFDLATCERVVQLCNGCEFK